MDRDLRVSGAERAGAVRRLEQALRDGRISVAEFDDRMHAGYAARRTTAGH